MFPHLPGIYNLTNPDFIEANRQGEISPEQAALLGPAGSKFMKRFQRGSRLSGIAVILVLVFFLVVQALGIEISTPLVLAAFGLTLVILAVQIGGRWARAKRQTSLLIQDLARGLIQSGAGSLQFGKDSYLIVVGDRELQLPLGSKEGLSPGISYNIYYLPESGVVLSAEPVEE